MSQWTLRKSSKEVFYLHAPDQLTLSPTVQFYSDLFDLISSSLRTVAFRKFNLDELLKATDIPSTAGSKTPTDACSVRYLEKLSHFQNRLDL